MAVLQQIWLYEIVGGTSSWQHRLLSALVQNYNWHRALDVKPLKREPRGSQNITKTYTHDDDIPWQPFQHHCAATVNRGHCDLAAPHYDDVIMSAVASQITSLTIVYSIVYSDADQRKHQSPASLAFVWGIHRGPVNSPHKWPVTRKMFPLDDVIMDEISWRHQMEAFSASLAHCAGNSLVTGEFPSKRPVTRSLDVFFDLRPNKLLCNNRHAGDLTRHHAYYASL